MTALTGLLASFRPSEWREETYAKEPPFVIENESGRVYLIPRDHDAEVRLGKISSSLGLKKVQDHPGYLVSRANVLKTVREFEWLVRRSWRTTDLSILWALLHLGEGRDWTQSDISIEAVAEAAGLQPRECGDSLRRLFHAGAGDGDGRGLRECVADRRLVKLTLERQIAELPTWTEEVVMAVMCSSPGKSVAEIYENVRTQGVSVGAIYKVAEHLKEQGFLRPVKHFRVDKRGPMREMLSANCQNCFYGFTDPDACLRDSVRQLEGILRRDFNKTPTQKESSAMFASMKAIPYGSRANRRVLSSLRLIHEINRDVGEEGVSCLLRRIETNYGVELPIRGSSEQP
jgi:predicted Zn-ribbon and HTH transcriptional regulator